MAAFPYADWRTRIGGLLVNVNRQSSPLCGSAALSQGEDFRLDDEHQASVRFNADRRQTASGSVISVAPTIAATETPK